MTGITREDVFFNVVSHNDIARNGVFRNGVARCQKRAMFKPLDGYGIKRRL
jgi:hypothetical protein